MESLREFYKVGTGPSSSHTMGPRRAALDFIERCPSAVRFRVVLFGSLAATGKGHLTDEIVIKTFSPKPCEVIFNEEVTDLPHPNVLDIEGFDENGNVLLKKRYLSIGGGSIRVDGEPEAKPKDVYPFRNFSEIRDYCLQRNYTLDKLVFEFEDKDIYAFLAGIWKQMQETILHGLKTEGRLPGKLNVWRKAKFLFETVDEDEEPQTRDNRLLCAFAFATSEENACGGTVVTAPTCGASGVLPAVLFFMSRKYGFSEKKIVSALAVAGIIGAIIKQNASVSGAEAGCQAEIGTATTMAAAAVCSLNNFSIQKTEYAAGIALEHQLGLTCDPVCGYVQIPCIERNAVASLRAIVSTELAYVLTGTRKLSFDLVVNAMYNTGKDLNARYRETSEGGLALLYRGIGGE